MQRRATVLCAATHPIELSCEHRSLQPKAAAMQHVSRFRCQQTSRAYSSAQPSGHALPQHPVQPSFRGARPCITHATPETADAGSSGEDQPVVRRRRLFRAGSGTSTTSSSSTGVGSNASTASRKRPASQGAEVSQEDVLDSFAAAFESMAVSPKKVGANMPCFEMCSFAHLTSS